MAGTIRVAIVIASTREGRIAPVIGRWVAVQAARRAELDVEVVDLDELEVPWRHPVDPAAVCGPLLDRLGRADAFVIVTPEYNHSFPAPLKQAIDLTTDQFRAKPVAFVTYGGISGGLRAAEQLRPVLSEMRAVTTRDCVSFCHPWDHLDAAGDLADPDGSVMAATAMFDELSWWATALNAARAPEDLTSGHALFVTHRAKPGRRSDVVAVWDRYLRPLAEQNPDHLAYFYCLDEADDDVVRVFQLYRSADAAKRFLDQPGYLTYLEHVLPLVAGPPQLDPAGPFWAKQAFAPRRVQPPSDG